MQHLSYLPKGAVRAAIATVCAAVTVARTVCLSQTPPLLRASDGLTFDVISIKPHPEDGPVSNVVYQRPDGGFSLTALPTSALIYRAYALTQFDDIVGLPNWATTTLYDVTATSSLSRATTEDRLAMWRAMLADRFGLLAHFEKRVRPAYDLVLARTDGRLGPGLTRVAVDCDAQDATLRAQAEAAIAAGLPWPPLQGLEPSVQRPCTERFEPQGPSRWGMLLTGEMTISALVRQLRAETQRMVVDKTGLSGSYHVQLVYDHLVSGLSPDAPSAPDAGPNIFNAVRQQLGLRLRSVRAEQDTLVIDNIDRPTEN